MPQFGGKNAKKTKKTSYSSKRHFTVVMGGKEHGLYVSSTPSSAARKAVTKLCTANKSKKVEFHIREITQGSKKKTYGPYDGYIEKLKEPIELKGRVIKYKPVAKLSGKTSKKTAVKKGGMRGGEGNKVIVFLFEGIVDQSNDQKNIELFLKNTQVRFITSHLVNYFIDNGTNINSVEITSPQILFNRQQQKYNVRKGNPSDTFPENLFEKDRFKDLVRQLQVLLFKWELRNIKFSIFISEGDEGKKYTLSNARSLVKTYSALGNEELTPEERRYNPGSLNPALY
jgi:hypothetical protein